MVRLPPHALWFLASVAVTFILWLFADEAPRVRDFLAENLGWIPTAIVIGLLIASILRTRSVDRQIKSIMKQQRGIIQSLVNAGIMDAPKSDRDGD